MRAVNAGSPVSSRTMPAALPSGPADLGPDGIAYRAQTIEAEDPFRILGVERGASNEAVRAAFVRLARVWHPDRVPPELHPFRAEVEKIFAYISRAHQTLCDPTARALYEKKSASAPPPPRERKDVMREIDGALGKREFAFAEVEAKQLAERDADDGEAQAIVAWCSALGGDAPEETLRRSKTSRAWFSSTRSTSTRSARSACTRCARANRASSTSAICSPRSRGKSRLVVRIAPSRERLNGDSVSP
jgi:curved DNA-binding protein CbpA